jgi:ABC-type multidrug transport system fused ATPase/permease subunit
VIAVVGPTGSGKSTLLGLLLRFQEPQHGTIEIDGVPIRQVSLASLRRQFALVPQESVIKGATVAENISYGAIDKSGRDGSAPSREEIVAAAQAANAHEFIVRLPDGYDTVVGERGGTLSGGQRQRLALARAHIRRSPIVLLDEPTNSLDAVAEQRVLHGLRQLLRGRTAVVIAHRLNTVRMANRIIFIEHGRIVEAGTHEELLASGGRYARFCAIEGGLLQDPSAETVVDLGQLEDPVGESQQDSGAVGRP